MTTATSEPCPSCEGTLRLQAVVGVCIDVCDACHGVWFDDGELETYRQRIAHDGRPGSVLANYSEGGPRRRCPSCAIDTLAERSVAGRPVLHCAGCAGLFLTASELRSLVPKKEGDWSWVDLADAAEVLRIPLDILEIVAGILAA